LLIFFCFIVAFNNNLSNNLFNILLNFFVFKEKSIYNIDVSKIMQIDIAFLTNILIFCDKENKNKSLKLLYFKKSKDIKS